MLHILALLGLLSLASAQFGFFEQMFNQQGGGGGRHQHQAQNAGSDSAWYRHHYDGAQCDHYLCPGTLSCVHFPHHCPCAFPEQEDKIEFGDGSMLCASKGGYKVDELKRKVELARKGLL